VTALCGVVIQLQARSFGQERGQVSEARRVAGPDLLFGDVVIAAGNPLLDPINFLHTLNERVEPFCQFCGRGHWGFGDETVVLLNRDEDTDHPPKMGNGHGLSTVLKALHDFTKPVLCVGAFTGVSVRESLNMTPPSS
jgi:hypothetical protein